MWGRFGTCQRSDVEDADTIVKSRAWIAEAYIDHHVRRQLSQMGHVYGDAQRVRAGAAAPLKGPESVEHPEFGNTNNVYEADCLLDQFHFTAKDGRPQHAKEYKRLLKGFLAK